MYLEHANITVPSIEKSLAFLKLAFPDFERRGGGPLSGKGKYGDEKLGQWAHVGTEQTYIALQEPAAGVNDLKINYESPGINHLGFVVEDVYSIIERCKSEGYEPTDASAMGAHPYRDRVYFIDGSGVEWEFVQYLSEDKSKQNDYAL